VLQGVVAQALTLGAIGYYFGFIALFFYFMQARTAIFMLETVNYIEHWGLQRTTKKVIAIDSWDSDNYFTLYTLVGLSRHADHHAQASRPYQKLRHFDETAKMPLGYYGTIVMSAFQNAKYQELATAELKRKRLGPFRVEGTAPVSHLHPSLRPLDTDAVA
jgi:alkane 1-monooxygenase